MSSIVVDLGWVLQLHGEVTDTTGSLRAAPADAVGLPSSPTVDSGSTDFMKKWDERAGELADCLESVGELLAAIHEGFSTVDNQLGNATQGP
jgi:hypothetical protein